MTTVEDAHALVEAPPHGVKILQRPKETTGWFSWITTVDHKKIAIMYGTLAICFFLVGGIEALFIRLQLARPDGTVLSAARYNEFFTMHGTTMVFLLGMPIAAAFGNYLVPLMIGARDVAFPRLNMLGFWIFAFGGGFLYSSFALGGAPNGGWFGYAPLTSTPMSQGYLPGRGPDFWTVGLIMLGIGSVATAVNFLVTIINMRAPGMTMMRLPVFVWMMLVVAFLTLFAMPPVTAALIMVFMDRNFHTTFFNAAAGGDPLMYQNLFWIFGHPEVYILILPGMGIVSEILPVFSRKPLFGYAVVVFSGIAIGFLGWGVWAHHMFASGLGPVAVSAFGLSTMLIAIPTGVKIFNWLGTVWGGAVRLATPMLFALGFIAQFTIGGLSGVMHSIVPSDTQQTDTYFVVAHFHYVLFGGLVFAVFGGFYYWWPKFFGYMLNDRIGKLNFWLMVIGFNLTFFPMHFLGFEGQPRRTYTYPKGMGWDFMNLLATIGAFIIALSVATFLVNVIFSARRRSEFTSGDPWDARSLEWMTSSPPPEYNFAEVPIVTHRDEFWHRKYTEDDEGRLVKLPAGTAYDVDAEMKKPVDAHSIHMPSPSYWPLIFALGLPILGYGFVFKNWWLLAAGVVVGFYGITGWALEPPTEPDAHHQELVDVAGGAR
ncbi:MAG TPA: cytochrome c oxidase subunit I [Acidimicrobiia bacterium]|nr:cytochrome c oxidase subunit I [Acidimicrobiia bacterium]